MNMLTSKEEEFKSTQNKIDMDRNGTYGEDRLINIISSCIDVISSVLPPIKPIKV